ncbi:hypothetical protein LDZ77_08400 [Bacteroides xylanisolvens]|uniref:Uncharacterized protein n=1 Tax=Bacteroides xylanisolvens TaxID=371601 RepID=A0AAW4SY85_9BACE|nr:hypothetical protein [Bacteroides xylanisolvens]MCA4550614.1 hypothetical protein [Bacteroides xylanisolvens]MCA4564060.1 hypothetical protein [Bacteroides xylanisolvens]MCA4568686.1 hypothetical protein [Bacteroides xylanisolvens]MCA4608122.1 hypothetical protein [Bacteroides xylanisolvens]MCA4613383.1 hypothetical protein [Bacteroides xylanisolvens]
MKRGSIDSVLVTTGLRICGVSPMCCGGTFRIPSTIGLTSYPSFSAL